MKAVVIERPHEAAYREVGEPAGAPGDVLVRSHAAGVCRTDVEVLLGELDPRWVRYPCIPGHEWSGTVVACGERVAGVAPGDRVVCEGIIPCRRCARCRAGDTNICLEYEALGFTRGGGYGELVAVPHELVHALPAGLSLDAAVLVEPASVVLRGLERGRLAFGESLGVVGVGTLGALAIVLAKLHSPREIVAYGIRDEELELARRLGADHVVHVERGESAGGHDLVLETAGAPAAVDLASRLPREGGRAVLIGICGAGRTLAFPPDRLTLRDVELIGSVGYTTPVWTRLVGLAAAGLVDLGRVVTHRLPVDEFSRGFELITVREGIVAKVLLLHGA